MPVTRNLLSEIAGNKRWKGGLYKYKKGLFGILTVDAENLTELPESSLIPISVLSKAKSKGGFCFVLYVFTALTFLSNRLFRIESTASEFAVDSVEDRPRPRDSESDHSVFEEPPIFEYYKQCTVNGFACSMDGN